MTKTRNIYLALLATVLSPMAANADVIPFGPATVAADGGNITVNLAVSTATQFLTGMNLTFQGDFGQTGEQLTVIVEGIIIGTLAPGLTSTGAFGTPVSAGFGTNFNLNPISAAALLSLDVSSFVADGFLTVIFDASDAVANFGASQVGLGPFAGLNSFALAVAGDVTTTTRVPEPGTLALLGLGLAGMSMTRRKKKV